MHTIEIMPSHSLNDALLVMFGSPWLTAADPGEFYAKIA
jgi:hypothetical protein